MGSLSEPAGRIDAQAPRKLGIISRTGSPAVELLDLIRAAVVVTPARARPILQAPVAAAAKVQHFKRFSQRRCCLRSAFGVTRRGARELATDLHQQHPHLCVRRLVWRHVVLPTGTPMQQQHSNSSRLCFGFDSHYHVKLGFVWI